VDEAHLLANPTSKRRRAVALLRARWRLLLTATPVANKLTDLYSLVDLARPGAFGTPREFEAEYVADPGTARVVKPRRVAALREAVRDVSCRTRRAETEIAFTARRVETHTIAMAPDEDAMVADVTTYLRALYRRLPPPHARATQAATAERGGQAAKANRGALIREILALQQSLSSSPRAIAWSLRRRAERHPDERDTLLALAGRCERVESAKERLLLALLDELRGEPALVFTLRLQTAERLRAVLRERGRAAECYVGALARAEREELVERFNGGEVDALIATDAGAEGLNLQRRCRTVINYDLHWNPMRIEQRIGRVHRLGQSRDVAVHNFALRDTVDEYVLRLLYEKISLFTMTVGALETVLAEAHDGELDMEERLLEALLTSDTRERLTAEVAALGTELSDARNRQHDAESLTEGVLG
jgi:SNF2 family DNA or RNA helicase